jgi:3-deoxy-7-phosphoheptulonate synthase
VTKQGVAAIVATRGNRDCHVILRGGTAGPNFSAESIAAVSRQLEQAGRPGRVMVDCSHANSGKDYQRQPEVARALAEQVRAGSRAIVGAMLESFLVDGRQDVAHPMVYGRSITDPCMGWERTLPLFAELADAVRARRQV